MDEMDKFVSLDNIKNVNRNEVKKQENLENRDASKTNLNVRSVVHRIKPEDALIRERKENVINFFKNKQTWVIGLLIVALILGVYIRSMPMHDHGGNPGLWNVATNDWTLGPDLDPWLFLRIAEDIVNEGSIPERDELRNVPLGFDNSKETQVLPYMIAYTHYFFNIFGDYPIEFAGAIFPVIMFGLTIIAFFLFVREIFVRKSKKSKINANIISLLSTFFMIVIPVFLSRTIAGIPEKESAVFFFMFLAFYLFLKAWNSASIRGGIILSILAGIATAGAGLVSGLFIYVYICIAFSGFLAFILNKFKKKEIIVYFCWWIMAAILLSTIPGKVNWYSLISSLTLIPAFILLGVLIFHNILWNTKLSENSYIKKIRLPKTIISLIIALLIMFLIVIIFNPSLLIEKIKVVQQILFKPITGRWNTTVAENRQPYFSEWAGNFGPFVKEVPLFFWLFFAGSVVLFKKMINPIKNKDALVLTGLYIFAFIGLVFSRYSSSSLFNGENILSKLFYFGTLFLFFVGFIYYYIKYDNAGNENFEKINFGYILLFMLFGFTLFSARSAVRLIMILGPISTIFVSYLIVESINRFRKTRDETLKILIGALVILILVCSIFSFWTFYNTVKVQAYNFVPSHYNQQWQNSMRWVDDETPQDAVFAHWWDYGYWLQSIGNRATVLDGGNAITYWNYLMGRHVLTGDNQEDALEFLYNHDADYLLIDSSDIGKYGAFSSIGSDENYDRYSWIGTFLLDESQTQETQNQTLLVYPGGIGLDEDLIIEEDGKEILLPGQNAGVGAIIIPSKQDNEVMEFMQPYALIVYQGQQHKVNLKYLEVGGQFVEFDTGIEACAFVFPKLDVSGQGVSQNPIGAAMYLSPRLLRGYLVQKYILDDPFNNFPNFKLAHTQSNLILENLRNQGMDLPDFVYYQGLQGPIKIWEIEYTGNEKEREDYLDKDATKYLSWNL